MSVTDDLFDLINVPTSSIVAGRIFISQTPENYSYVGPYIVISGVGDVSEEDLTGGIGLATERFEFSCRAKVTDGGNLTCRQLAEIVRVAIQGATGGVGMVFGSASHASALDLYDPDLNIHIRATDFEVMYSEQPTSAV